MGRLKLYRRGFRPKDAPAPSIARNAGKEKGKGVTAADVAPYALPMHPPCRGKGWVIGRRDISSKIPSLPEGGQASSVIAVPCKCATKRFLKAHPEVILDDAGNA